MRLKEFAAARVRYGYRRLHILLRREGWEVRQRIHSALGYLTPEQAERTAG